MSGGVDLRIISFTAWGWVSEEIMQRETQLNKLLNLFGFAEPYQRALCVTHISTIPNIRPPPQTSKPPSQPKFSNNHFLHKINKGKNSFSSTCLDDYISL